MNLKKLILKVVVVIMLFMTIFMTMSVFPKVKATDLTSPVYFGISNIRKYGMGYAIGNPKDYSGFTVHKYTA